MNLKKNVQPFLIVFLSYIPFYGLAQDEQNELTHFEECLVNNALSVLDDLCSYQAHLVYHLIAEDVSASWMDDPFETATPSKGRFLSSFNGALGNEMCSKLQTHDFYAEFIYIDPEDDFLIYPEESEDCNWLKLSWVFPTEEGLASIVISFKENEDGWQLTKVELYS